MLLEGEDEFDLNTSHTVYYPHHHPATRTIFPPSFKESQCRVTVLFSYQY